MILCQDWIGKLFQKCIIADLSTNNSTEILSASSVLLFQRSNGIFEQFLSLDKIPMALVVLILPANLIVAQKALEVHLVGRLNATIFNALSHTLAHKGICTALFVDYRGATTCCQLEILDTSLVQCSLRLFCQSSIGQRLENVRRFSLISLLLRSHELFEHLLALTDSKLMILCSTLNATIALVHSKLKQLQISQLILVLIEFSRGLQTEGLFTHCRRIIYPLLFVHSCVFN